MSARRQGTTRLRDIGRENRVEPPSRASIEALPPLGDRAAAIDLSGLSIRLEGLDEPLGDSIARRFSAYVCPPERAASPLVVSCRRDTIEYYVEPERHGPEGYYRLRIVHDAALVRMVTYSMAAWIDVASARAGVALGTGTFDPPERAIENFLRVAVAWMAVARGGFFIHGASIVREGRAYVFFGKSAAGKSTLAAMNTEGKVVSDDLTLVLPGERGLAVAGSPFRGTYEGGEPIKGLFPLVGMFRLFQGTTTRVEKPRKVLAFAELVANLPFVNDALGRAPGILESLESTVSSVPIFFLHFRKDPDFWRAVDEALAGG